jgi:dienelactone hydrolase
MVGWGAVVIATNYTHAGGVPIGLPGTADERGASAANVARGRKLLELLQSLGYVDMSRVAAHGHSGGAFVTTALVGAAPQAFRAASHSAGGIRPDVAPDIALQLPSESQASAIRAPYQMHHGDNDAVVPLIVDQLFANLLTTRSVTHELVIHPGAGHNDIAESSEVLDRVRSWYRTHGVLNR